MKLKYLAAFALFVFGIACFSKVNAQSANGDKDAAKAFVQKFYDWYVVLSTKQANSRKGSASDIMALNKHPEYFDARLRKAIINDRFAQSKANEIVGLESDPFLNAQDIGFGYQAGNVKKTEKKFFVDIHCDNESKSKEAILAAEVRVIAEVSKVNEQWIFVNFIYPVDGKQYNLLDELKGFKQDREKSKHKS